MTDNRIMTLHPEGKQGVNIDREKYETVKAAILGVLEDRGPQSFSDLSRLVAERLGESFDGSPGWYTTTIKLDLEARGLLERRGRSPQMVYRV